MLIEFRLLIRVILKIEVVGGVLSSNECRLPMTQRTNRGPGSTLVYPARLYVAFTGGQRHIQEMLEDLTCQ